MTKTTSAAVAAGDSVRIPASRNIVRQAAPESPAPRSNRRRGQPSMWNLGSILFMVGMVALTVLIAFGLHQFRGGSLKAKSSPAELLDLH